MILEYFNGLTAGLEAKLHEGGQEHVARKRFALEISRIGQRLFGGQEPVAWCGVLAPFDLLGAMGVTSCFAEFVGALLSSAGMADGLLSVAEELGYSTDSCGYHRAVMGAAERGLMPQPEFLIATTAPCTGGLAVIETLARRFKKDLFILQIPQHDTEEGVARLADELRRMVDFVAAHTGQPLDPARLRAVMACTNRVRDLLTEVYRLAQAVPSPARRRDLFNFGIVMSLLLGSRAGVEVAEAYRDEFARKVAAGVAGRPGERLRLMWLQNRIQFKSGVEELLEDQLGAAIVCDELNDITWEAIDPDDPYRGLAARILSVALVGPAERRLRRLRHLAHAYRVDGALNPCHWGCRQGSGARGLVAAGLRDAGIPVLNLEVDCIDQRNFAVGQLRTRIEAFVEMLAEGPRRRPVAVETAP